MLKGINQKMELNENTILVTGGSGLVGKHLQDILPNAVYISSRDYDLHKLIKLIE